MMNKAVIIKLQSCRPGTHDLYRQNKFNAKKEATQK
ncbi:MAG: hypothetical protein ACI9S8_002229 [Chlamydiales bacterium]|jgi:hypothetical protein